MDISRLPANKYVWLCFFILLVTALFTNLSYSELHNEEPRRAIVSLEMSLSGNYIVPKINEYDYYNKAPVYNWFLILFYKIFGSADEWVVRLPTIFSLLSVAVINFLVVTKKVGIRAGFYSSCIFVTSSNILFYFSFQGEIDMFYTLIVYLQIISILHFFQKEQYAPLFLISYLLTGIGVLTKGIPSLAFQAITLLTVFIYHKRFRALFSLWNFAGIFLMLLIMGGYFYLYSLQEDPLPMITRLITESSKRTVAEQSWYNSLANLYRFPLLMITLMLPWSLLPLSPGISKAWQQIMRNRFVRLSFLFVISNVVIYWLSPGTRDRYLYMFVPFIGIIIYQLYSYQPNKLFSWVILFLLLVLLAGSLAIPFYSEALTLQQNLLLAAFIFSFSAICLYGFFKYPEFRIFQFITFMLLARIAFNFLVIPSRDVEKVLYAREAEKLISHNVKGLISEEEPVTIFNPVLRRDVTIPLIDHPPYQLSYYFTKKTLKTLPFSDAERAGMAYVTDIGSFREGTQRQVLDTIYVKNGRPGLIIYNYKAQTDE